ncbi:MAG TPA: C39 family peptidase [Candidatus Sulfopaludibacter sp.]|jgi:hypothetical protein|nr:C39 family peptidase [Candidatus Sulfopaludibacter sp.]
MDSQLHPSLVHRLAATELNLLNLAHTLPGMRLEGAAIDSGTPIYDPNGEILFYRVGLRHGDVPAGYADLAAHTLFGEPLLGTAPDADWDAEYWIAAGRAALQRMAKSPLHYDDVRLVAFSYPKLAVQFLERGKELIMLELVTWAVVPPAHRDRPLLEVSNFERFSLIAETPADVQREAHARFEDHVARLENVRVPETAGGGIVISKAALSPSFGVLSLYDTEDLHYSALTTDHHTCYELRGQETNVWCVVASTQMVLDFYRYNYTQSRIAQQLGLGTLSNPSGLPYARDNDVAVALNAMSSGALTANMLTTPAFSAYTAEIRANRPLISFIPGHSRSVAGYTQSIFYAIAGHGYQGLLVYDPWPPNSGVITRWENFNTQTYRRAFTAHVTTI